MLRQDAEKIINEYVKPVFGFALKKCALPEDAEDLAQEIVLRAYRMLLLRDDIADPGKYVWTIAHNCLANHYRQGAKNAVGTSIDELAETLIDDSDALDELLARQETVHRLQSEIAYLSKLQRRILIAYYYENKKQGDIAAELDLPLGTVKWHLFEAKKELKRGMETMRTSGELKFNPIEFTFCGMNGSLGSRGGTENFFRSALSQNITYAVWREARTVNEIADALGVSPAYVESEVEFLERYSFLTKVGDKYLCNILLDEATEESLAARDHMYRSGARLFANELYEALHGSGLLEDERIYCGAGTAGKRDKNYMLWALIPYVAANSGKKLEDRRIRFDEVATIRPDGGHNICRASILAPGLDPVTYFQQVNMVCWSGSGPCWNGNKNMTIWVVDSHWSDKRIDHGYEKDVQRDIILLERLEKEPLSEEEYAWLVRRGYLLKGENGFVRQGLWMDEAAMEKFLAVGDQVKERLWPQLEKLPKPYVELVLSRTPEQLRKVQEYELQGVFHCDGWFTLHCMNALVESGKLALPTEEQKRSLTTLILKHGSGWESA